MRAHGIHGALVVEPLTNQPDRFAPGVCLLVGAGRVPMTVRDSTPYKGRILLRLDGVTDRDGAESLRRQDIAIAAEDVGDPPPGEVWAADLEGLPVHTGGAGGDLVGTVVAVLDNPAHDLLLVQAPNGREFLVPIVEEFVDALEPGLDRVVVHLIPGLLPDDGE